MSTSGDVINQTSPERDRGALPSSLTIGVAFGCLAMLYSLVLYRYQVRWEHNVRIPLWYAPQDIWNTFNAGRFVWHGLLGNVYTWSGQSYALPLSYILAAPVAAIIDHYHLVEGLFPLVQPSAWPLVAIFTLCFNIFLLDAVRRIAWDLGVRRRLWQIQVAAVFVVLVPAFQFAHFEDVLALTFLLHACRYMFRAQPIRAALLLSLAISSKQWAILAIPLFVVLSPRGRRLLALAVSGFLPGLFVLLVVSSDPRHGFQSVFSPESPLNPKHNPGHFSFFYTWFGSKTSRATRSASVVLSPIVAWLFRHSRRAEVLLAGLSIVLVVRPLFEPTNFAYYWMPAFLFAGIVGVAAHRTFRVRDWIFQAFAILWTVPASNSNTSLRWWAIQAVLLVAIWLQVAINCGVTPRLLWRRPFEPALPTPERAQSADDRADAVPALSLGSPSTAPVTENDVPSAPELQSGSLITPTTR